MAVLRLASVLAVFSSTATTFRISSNSGDDRVLSMGCHHKTGTHLLKCIQGAWTATLGQTHAVTQWERHLHLKSHHSRLYQCLDASAFKLLMADTKYHYRLVHVVREPLNTVISGYWYHLNNTDMQLVSNTGPEILRSLTLEEGLKHEAKCQIRSTLQEMQGVVEATSGAAKVKTISLEDFVDDFDGTVASVHDFLFGEDHPLKDEMCRKAVACDATRFPDQDPGHILSKENYLKALTIIDQSQDPVWAEVRGFRQQLGFVDVMPGRWRLGHTSASQPSHSTEKHRSSSPEDEFAVTEEYAEIDENAQGAGRMPIGS